MNMRGIPRYTFVWGARYTLGARYLSKNTVNNKIALRISLLLTLTFTGHPVRTVSKITRLEKMYSII